MGKVLLPASVAAHLNEVAQKEGLTDISFEARQGSNHGDNFLGEIISVTLKGMRTICGIKVVDKLDLVCKISPSNTERRIFFETDAIFAREAFVYNELLPTFVEFQRQKGLSAKESFLSFPKCHLAIIDTENAEHIIIMDDIKVKGFSMWPKSEASRLDHCRLVIDALAKLHAVSFALKDQRPEVFQKFKLLNDLQRSIFNKSVKMFREVYDTVLRLLHDGNQKMIIEDFKENILLYFNNCISEDTYDRCSVVTHGDCWTNNVLFKYNNVHKSADKVCLLDWQNTRYASPALDFLHYIFTATDKKLRDEEYSNLTQLYYSTVSRTINKLGSDSRVLFSYNDFMRQLHKFGNYPFLISPFIIQLSLADSKEIGNMDEISEDMVKGNHKSLFNGYGEDSMLKFKKRIVGVIHDLIQLDYYTKIDNCVKHF